MAVPITTKPEEVVKLFRDMGLVGAGGAGFPTYFKYLKPPPILIVNAEEGEPGYEANKLILLKYTEAFVEVFDALKRIFGFEKIMIGAKDKDKERLKKLESIFEIAYTPSIYGMGEERWLTKALTGREVAADKLPSSVGVLVNNVETIYNMYKALFLQQPVTEKYVNVYGEVTEQRVLLAPVGTYIIDILGMIGVDTSRSHDLMAIDGGPMMGDKLTGEASWLDKVSGDLFTVKRELSKAGIKKSTNGILVADAKLYVRDQEAFRHLPGKEPPSWEDTLPIIMDKLGLSRYLDWNPQPEDILDIRDKVRRVILKLNQDGIRAKPSVPVVQVGQRVKVGDLIAKPVEGAITDFNALSVALHASIDGVVKEITGDDIRIEQA